MRKFTIICVSLQLLVLGRFSVLYKVTFTPVEWLKEKIKEGVKTYKRWYRRNKIIQNKLGDYQRLGVLAPAVVLVSPKKEGRGSEPSNQNPGEVPPEPVTPSKEDGRRDFLWPTPPSPLPGAQDLIPVPASPERPLLGGEADGGWWWLYDLIFPTYVRERDPLTRLPTRVVQQGPPLEASPLNNVGGNEEFRSHRTTSGSFHPRAAETNPPILSLVKKIETKK